MLQAMSGPQQFSHHSLAAPPTYGPDESCCVLQEASGELDGPAVGIVAIAGRLPQPALGVCAADAPHRVPLTRWETDTLVSRSAAEARFGSFVVGAELFDADVFGVSRCVLAGLTWQGQHKPACTASAGPCVVLQACAAAGAGGKLSYATVSQPAPLPDTRVRL